MPHANMKEKEGNRNLYQRTVTTVPQICNSEWCCPKTLMWTLVKGHLMCTIALFTYTPS